MSDIPIAQIFDDLFRYLEVLETQNRAILQLLKDRGIIADQQFAPYLEEAAVASDVKWRAARARMEHLFAQTPEPESKNSTESAESTKAPEKQNTAQTSEKTNGKAENSEDKKPEWEAEKKAPARSKVFAEKGGGAWAESDGTGGGQPGPKSSGAEPAKKEPAETRGSSEKETSVEGKEATKPAVSKAATEQRGKQPQAVSDEEKQPQFVAKP